jgi:hypothetical protein
MEKNMKAIVLAILLSSISLSALATPPSHGGHALVSSSSSQQEQVANGGDSSNQNSVTIEGDETSRLPVSTAIAPSVSTFADCQIATPSSKAISLWLISLSGTTGVNYNDLCYAYKRGQYDVADKLMCGYSQAYKAANPLVCGN